MGKTGCRSIPLGMMPQHTRIRPLADRQVRGEIARDVHGPADLHVGAGARIRIKERENHRLAPIGPLEAVGGSARDDLAERKLGFSVIPGAPGSLPIRRRWAAG